MIHFDFEDYIIGLNHQFNFEIVGQFGSVQISFILFATINYEQVLPSTISPKNIDCKYYFLIVGYLVTLNYFRNHLNNILGCNLLFSQSDDDLRFQFYLLKIVSFIFHNCFQLLDQLHSFNHHFFHFKSSYLNLICSILILLSLN